MLDFGANFGENLNFSSTSSTTARWRWWRGFGGVGVFLPVRRLRYWRMWRATHGAVRFVGSDAITYVVIAVPLQLFRWIAMNVRRAVHWNRPRIGTCLLIGIIGLIATGMLIRSARMRLANRHCRR